MAAPRECALTTLPVKCELRSATSESTVRAIYNFAQIFGTKRSQFVRITFASGRKQLNVANDSVT